jgi:hypothetical protein
MLRVFAALSVMALLTVGFALSLNKGNNAIAALLPGNDRGEILLNSHTGQPVTLEMVQKDVQWHRDTARKLRELD